MSEQEEKYTPTPADEALQATLLTGQVCMAIQQEYANGKLADLDTYNRLYGMAIQADAQMRKLWNVLELSEKGSKQ